MGFFVRRWFLTVGVTLLLGLATAAFGPVLTDTGFRALDWQIGLLGIACLGPVVYEVVGGGGILRPPAAVGLVMFLCFVIRSIILLHWWRDAGIMPYLRMSPEDYLPETISFVMTAWLFTLIGYYAPIGSVLARLIPSVPVLSRPIAPERVNWLLQIGWIARCATLLSMFMPEETFALPASVAAVVSFLTRLPVLAIVLMSFLLYTKDQRHQRRSIIIQVVLQFLWGLFLGMKLDVALGMIAWAVSRIMFRRSSGARELASVVALYVLFAMPAVGFVRDNRESARDFSGHLGLVVESVARVFGGGETTGRPGRSSASSIIGGFDRFHGTDSVATSLITTPRIIPFQPADNYWNLIPLAVVPRLLWPDKPSMITVMGFEREFFGLETSAGFARYTIGSLYICFDKVGACLWMCALGIFWRLLDGFIRKHSGVFPALAYFLFLKNIVVIEVEIPILYAQLIHELLLIPLFALVFGQIPIRGRSSVDPSRQAGPVTA